MQYTLNELIAKLEQIRDVAGGEIDVQGYGVNDYRHFHGVDCILWNYDNSDKQFVVIMHDGWA